MTKLFLFTLTVSILFINADCKKDIVDPPPISQTQDTGVKITDGIHPAISPNGQWIAFSRYGSIFICDTSGDNEKQLTSNFHDILPRFSPNGIEIGFVRMLSDSEGIIYRISLIDSSIQNLSGANGVTLTFLKNVFTKYPIWDWSPTGNFLAFLNLTKNGDVFVKVIVSNGSQQLSGNYRIINSASSTGGNYAPCFEWAPDGNRIVCISNSIPGTSHVGIISIGSDSIKQLSKENGEVFPFWAVNGEKIYYQTLWDGRLNVVDLKSGLESNLDLQERMYSPKISPNGKNILYATSEYIIPPGTDLGYYSSYINIMDIETKRIIKLTSNGSVHQENIKNYFYEWDNSSKTIYFERNATIFKINY